MLSVRRKRVPPPEGLIGPESVEIGRQRIRAGEVWCQTFAATRYPSEVGPGWLSPLLGYPGAIDVALHVTPIANDIAAIHLRRQRARFESTKRMDVLRQRLADPEIEAAAADAAELAANIARGDGRLFRVALYATVRARTPEELESEAHKVYTLMRSLLLEPRPVSWRAWQGWISTLPVGIDLIGIPWTFDTRALAAAFPFASAELNHTGGIFYGRNVATGSLVFIDRFSLENFNQVVLAQSGAGKSYLAKLQILRSLYQGIDVLVVDPENEYERLARAVGGTVLRLGAGGARLNPLDLADPGQPEALRDQSMFVHSVMHSLLGGVDATERALLDAAITASYTQAGITADVRTHQAPAPLLHDIVAHLANRDASKGLADRLLPFVAGSHRGLFDGPTTVRPEGHLVAFSLADLPEELCAAGMLLALAAIRRTVTRGDSRPRIVVVDEAWKLLRRGGAYAALFLEEMAKAGRKHWCGLTTITQDAHDVLASELGQAVVTNSSSQILLSQSVQSIEVLAKTFNLSAGEQAFLMSCDRGQGLFCIGTERAAVQVMASDAEHRLATSSPAELAVMEERA